MSMRKFHPLIVLAVVITLANGALLAYSLKHKTAKASAPPIANILQPQKNVKNADLKIVDNTKKGELLGTGEYKYQSLDQSKIKDGSSAQLVVAANESEGGHFVFALLGDNTKIPLEQIKSGWTITSIANDKMWAPGACSSKPTYLLQGKYIFIDDGKTNPNDKYNSYIVFNMTTGKYNYFGGDNFTSDQGQKERIINTANENDKLVFYIDPVDETGLLAGNTEGKHLKGADHSYIIRREIDPATMKYTDYSLPFTVPASLTAYNLNSFGFSSDGFEISLNGDGSEDLYKGTITDNHISLKLWQPKPVDQSIATSSTYDTQLELQLNDTLINALPNLAKQGEQPPSYKTRFGINEQGSANNLDFLIISQRSGDYYETPAIFDKNSHQLFPLTDSKIFQTGQNYVALGVF